MCLGQLKAQKQPNVLFILADDLGVNALNCYGNEKVESLHIDKLAKEGMQFTNGYANDPTCAPSRSSIMTGQYVPRHGVYRVSDRFKQQKNTLLNMRYLPPENNHPSKKNGGLSLDKITIAEALQTAGYATAAFGKWHCGGEGRGMDEQGFDESVETNKHYNFKSISVQKDILENEYNADYTTRKGIDFINKQAKEGQPFFLYMPYYLVHKPLEPKPEYLAYFTKKYSNELSEDVIKVLAMIKSLDESVGQLVKALEAAGLTDETLIIFTSDNGHYKTDDNFFNQPYQGAKGTTLEGGIRVPYIFKYPGKIKVNSQSTEPIIHVDIYPTLLNITRADLPHNHILDGENLVPILFGEKTKTQREELVWQYTNYAGYNAKRKDFRSSWVNVIQAKGYKMTEDVETGTYRLFDLNEDPFEKKEISALHPQKITELRALLENWKENTGSAKPRPNPGYRLVLKSQPTTSKQKKKKVFLFAGQSNMDGRADAAGVSEEDKIRLKKIGDRIQFYYNRKPVSPLQFSTPAKHTQRKFSLEKSFGPEVFFGINLAEKYPKEEFIFIKVAKGGTSLYGCWNPEWSEDKAGLMNEENAPKLYQDFTNYTKEVLAQYNQEEYEIIGMLWIQGESDSGTKRGTRSQPSIEYGSNLQKLIAGVRKKTGVSDLPFVLFQVGSGKVVKGMQSVSQNDANVYMIPQSREENSPNYYERNPPPVGHYTAASMKRIGKQFFNIFQKIIVEHE